MSTGIDVVLATRFLLTGIALVLAFLAAITWNRREDAPEATMFAVLVASMAVYTFAYAGEIVQTTVEGAHYWLNIEYLALPWAGALWVLSACKQNGIQGRAPLLFIVPVLTFVGYFTNYNGLFFSSPLTLVHNGPFYVLSVSRGPLSTLDNAYLIVSFGVGAWIYIRALRYSSSLFRKQAAIVLLCSFLPFAGYFAYLTGLTPWGIDITPVTLGVTCCLLYYGIFHCGIFDLAPLARNLIFNSMRDAVLILDSQDRLLDFNPAAKALLPILNRRNFGIHIGPMLAGAPRIAEAIDNPDESTEVTVGEENPRLFEVQTLPLFSIASSAASRRVGRAIVFADVTSRARLREELRHRAETDPLTGAANRQRFYNALEVECLRFSRNKSPLAVLMVDLDDFRSVNEVHGNGVGDALLHTVAQLLMLCLRKTDLLARFSGEEFTILLPETPLEGAQIIAERIRQAICQKPILAEGCLLQVTISIGLASHAAGHDPDHEATPELLIKKAELALYRAKSLGRNRVELG